MMAPLASQRLAALPGGRPVGHGSRPVRHHPVLGTFRSFVSGHKADGKRWCMPYNPCAGATLGPLASPHWHFLCLWAGTEPTAPEARFWRWWVSQGKRPSGSHDLMYPPRSAGGGFAFRFRLGVAYGRWPGRRVACYIAGLHHPDGALGRGAQDGLQRFTIASQPVDNWGGAKLYHLGDA